MDNTNNKILPIEATINTNNNARTIIMKKTLRRKRCRNGTRRHKKSHRCRKVLIVTRKS